MSHKHGSAGVRPQGLQKQLDAIFQRCSKEKKKREIFQIMFPKDGRRDPPILLAVLWERAEML